MIIYWLILIIIFPWGIFFYFKLKNKKVPSAHAVMNVKSEFIKQM